MAMDCMLSGFRSGAPGMEGRLRRGRTNDEDRAVNVRQLRYFHLSAAYGSFSAAARAEGVSVQAVSKALIELEEELGGSLFDRSGKRMRLTPLGEATIEKAQEAVESFDAVTFAAHAFLEESAAEREEYHLALITPPFAKHQLITASLSRLFSRMLRADVTIRVALGDEAMVDLESGALDALFTVGAFVDPRCTCLPIGNVAVGAFVGRRHPLRRKEVISFEELAPYPVLHNQRIDGFNETVLTTCLKEGLASPLVEISTDEEVADFLEHDQGYILGIYLKALDIKPLAFMHRIDPADAPTVPVCMVTLKDSRGAHFERLDHFVRHEFKRLKGVLNE